MMLYPKSARSAVRHIATAASVLLAVGTWAASAQAQQATITDFPFVIYCEYQGIAKAYYFSQLENGRAIYLTPDRQVGTITIDGVSQGIKDDGRQGSCADKTLDDLRSSGQAFDLPH